MKTLKPRFNIRRFRKALEKTVFVYLAGMAIAILINQGPLLPPVYFVTVGFCLAVVLPEFYQREK